MSSRSDEAAALQANADFYAAFASGDIAAMGALWSNVEMVLCMHPGGHPISGRTRVMRSWRDLFDSGGAPIRFSEDRVSLIRGLAFVTCLEHLGDVVLAASNVLIWENGTWRFVLHNAGVVADPDAIDDEPGSREVLH